MFWRTGILISEYLSTDRISESKISVSIFFVLDLSYTKFTLNSMYELGNYIRRCLMMEKDHWEKLKALIYTAEGGGGREELANLKLKYFFTWRHRKAFHCLSWKQQFHTQVGCSRKKKPAVIEAILCLQGQHEERNWEPTGERQHLQSTKTIKGTHFPWAAFMCTETPTAAAETFLRYLHRAEHITWVK